MIIYMPATSSIVKAFDTIHHSAIRCLSSDGTQHLQQSQTDLHDLKKETT